MKKKKKKKTKEKRESLRKAKGTKERGADNNRWPSSIPGTPAKELKKNKKGGGEHKKGKKERAGFTRGRRCKGTET